MLIGHDIGMRHGVDVVLYFCVWQQGSLWGVGGARQAGRAKEVKSNKQDWVQNMVS